MKLRLDDAGKVYRSPLFDGLEWLDHAFGTAAGDPPFPTVTLKQIHSARIIPLEEHCEGLEGDALAADVPGSFVGVKTADCLPVLIADVKRRVVASMHAGWRGTSAGIATKTVRFLNSRYGSQPQDLRAAMGPAIQECCFEVGPEVAVEFQSLFPERNDLNGRTRISLAEANRRLLEATGVPGWGIATQAPCTVCSGMPFHSWRRDKTRTGRMISAIGIRGMGGA